MSRSLGIPPAVQAYVQAANRAEHPEMARCRRDTETLGALARMQISPEQASFQQLMVALTNARDAIEIGVFTGYSALATALAMQVRHGDEARLVACDISSEFMGKAVVYFEAAGVANIVEPRIGPAIASLDDLLDNDEAGGFDLAFIDADKTGYLDYYERCAMLLRPGGVMMFDNVLWSGAVADPAKTDADTLALRAVAERAKADERIEHAFTTIGDGLLVCVRR